MRVKKVFCLLLMVACLMVQAVPVFAAEGGFTAAQLEALPKPGADVKLISYIDLEKSGNSYVYPSGSNEVRLSNMYGKAKVVVYDVNSGTYLYTCDDGTEFEGVYYPSYVTKSTSSLQTALSDSIVLEETDRFDSRVSGVYVMFFSASATSLDDIVYCVSSEEIVKHYKPDENTFNGSGANNFTVTVLSKQPSEGVATSATFRLDYELGEGDEFWGSRREEKLSQIYVDTLNRIYVQPADRKVSGSIEFTLNPLRNGTYNIEISTDMGNVYQTSFEVDFASNDGGSSLLEDMYTGSYDAPVVSFDGLPAEGVTDLLDPVFLTIKTDIPAKVVFGDNIFGSYTISNEVVLTGNGEYHYSAESEVGQVTEGVLKVSCFDPNASIAISGMGLESVDSRLVQTGFEAEESTIVPVVIMFGVVVVVAGAVILKRRSKA